jgi:hypothetical protein
MKAPSLWPERQLGVELGVDLVRARRQVGEREPALAVRGGLPRSFAIGGSDLDESEGLPEVRTPRVVLLPGSMKRVAVPNRRGEAIPARRSRRMAISSAASAAGAV